ncbi:uncharacterized protein METZ01_LOCUS198389 [marine metagenome]|uniref:Uncharacterized protein n=1 Tax=marine metagenome TaxID=408172 RepID=A0A382E518_9ZZZZ
MKRMGNCDNTIPQNISKQPPSSRSVNFSLKISQPANTPTTASIAKMIDAWVGCALR